MEALRSSFGPGSGTFQTKVPVVLPEELAGGNELLAASELTTTVDDECLAREHSLFERGDVQMEHWRGYVPFLPILYALAFVLKVFTTAYRRWMPYNLDLGQRVSRLIESGEMKPYWTIELRIRKILARFFQPIGYNRFLLGSYALNVFLGWVIHPYVTEVRENVTTSQALDRLNAANSFFPTYFRSILTKPWRILRIPGALFTWLVCNLTGPQAVRNRIKIVQPMLVQIYRELADRGLNVIEAVELACGSAEAQLKAIATLRQERPEVFIRLTLVDLSRESLRRAKRYAEHLGVADCLVIPTEGNLQKFLAKVSNCAFHVVGVVGFVDYRMAKSCIGLFSEIRRVVKPQGYNVCAQIAHGPREDHYLTENLIGWAGLIRREAEEYYGLLRQGGWREDEFREVPKDPWSVHSTSLCQKAM